MRPLKVAQIGASETCHAHLFLETLLEMPEIYEVVGYADVDTHRKPLPPCYGRVPRLSAEELLNDPTLDAVLIECDEVHQTHYALAAAERGLPLFLDKPGSPSHADFERLIDLIEEKALPFAMGYMYRFNPAVQKAMEAAKSGALGEIYSVEAQMSCPQSENTRRFLVDLPGGMLYYLGCHLLDLIYQLQGEPEAVVPLSAKVEPQKSYGVDLGMVALRYRNGVSYARTNGMERGGFLRRRLVIHGTLGSMEVCPLERLVGRHQYVSDLYTAISADWHTPADCETFPPRHRYRPLLEEFAAYVRGEKQNPYTPEYERRLHRLILKACEGY